MTILSKNSFFTQKWPYKKALAAIGANFFLNLLFCAVDASNLSM
jgi:hypothetical protein